MKAAAAAIAALIGIVTGLGTIVGWLGGSESLVDTAKVAVGWAGLTYFGFCALAVVVTAVLPGPRFRAAVAEFAPATRLPPAVARALFALSGAGFVLVIAATGADPAAFVEFGYLALAVVAVIAVVRVWNSVDEAHAAIGECPDCAELVKREALVCRHCGYRFRPPPEPFMPPKSRAARRRPTGR